MNRDEPPLRDKIFDAEEKPAQNQNQEFAGVARFMAYTVAIGVSLLFITFVLRICLWMLGISL